MAYNNSIHVSQWNSCGQGTKINALKMLILDAARQPDIIGIKESNEKCTIPGYDKYKDIGEGGAKSVDTFVKRYLPVKQHDIPLYDGSKAVVTEIIPKKKI